MFEKERRHVVFIEIQHKNLNFRMAGVNSMTLATGETFLRTGFFGVILWRRHLVISSELILIFWYADIKSDILNISSLYLTFLYRSKIFTPLVILFYSPFQLFIHILPPLYFFLFLFYVPKDVFRVKNWSRRWKTIQDFLDKFSILRNKLQPENSTQSEARF
jgi:hypothetical protein